MEILFAAGSILFALIAVFAVLGYSYYVRRKHDRDTAEAWASAEKALADCAKANRMLAEETGHTLAAMTDFLIAMIRVALETQAVDDAESGPELEFAVSWDKLPRAVLVRIVEEFGQDVVDRMSEEGF